MPESADEQACRAGAMVAGRPGVDEWKVGDRVWVDPIGRVVRGFGVKKAAGARTA